MNIEPAVVSAITALVAVIVGPIITLLVARKQINASVLSGNRQQWINRLRDELASLVAIVHHLPSAHANESISTDAAIEKYGEFVEKAQTVKLLINPKEPDHTNLVKLIENASDQIIASINSNRAKASELEAAAAAIVSCAQSILKREWERVKRGQ